MALLRSVNKTATALGESDPSIRDRLLREAEEISGKAQFDIIETRQQTESVEKRQGAPLKLVRQIAFVLGALLIIFGKTLALLHKSRD